jgi:hypothetical protein
VPFARAELEEVRVRDLRVGGAALDLLLLRHGADDVGVKVLSRSGQVEIILVK